MDKVGFRSGRLEDPARQDWSGTGPRPIAWSAWYPADERAALSPFFAGADAPFLIGDVARDAPLPADRMSFPVVLISHGTGGSTLALAWLAEALAARGAVVLGVDHHGNTISEPYCPEGFLAWWERPRDLTFLLDSLMKTGPFAGRLDGSRVAAAGHSLGGYSVLSLAGAITDMRQFGFWLRDNGSQLNGPREFPDLTLHLVPLLETSGVFQRSWAVSGDSHADPRVKAVLALAPAPTVRSFTAGSLAAIDRAVTIVGAPADREAPADLCCDWLAPQIAGCRYERLAGDAGHFVFLSRGSAAGLAAMPDILVDAPSVDRAAVHAQVVELAAELFGL